MAVDPIGRQRVVVTVHGIRTFGQWKERLESLLRTQSTSIEVVHYHYGYFSIFAFVIPFLRWIQVRRFRNALIQLSEKNPASELSIVAHSFGTHLVGWALRGLRGKGPGVKNVILAGSVLRSNFPWNPLIANGQVERVVNDCAIRDKVLLLSEFGAPLTGMAGRVGFNGMTGRALKRVRLCCTRDMLVRLQFHLHVES